MSLHKYNVTMYADDTSISHSAKDISDLNVAPNSDLDRLKGWLQGNKLSINVIKIQVMIVGSRPNLENIANNRVDTPSFVINGAKIDFDSSLRHQKGKKAKGGTRSGHIQRKDQCCTTRSCLVQKRNLTKLVSVFTNIFKNAKASTVSSYSYSLFPLSTKY